jgi:hypothetical protein
LATIVATIFVKILTKSPVEGLAMGIEDLTFHSSLFTLPFSPGTADLQFGSGEAAGRGVACGALLYSDGSQGLRLHSFPGSA